MTDKEAMKLALDALETLMIERGSIYEKAIAALKERLTQPEQEPVADNIASILACRDMLDAQPVPPRTWVGSGDLEDSNAYLTPPQRTEQGWTPERIEGMQRLKAQQDERLRLQRTWVGLTEQEHIDIAVECGCMSADWVFYGAAVERKVKERNQ